MAKRVYFKHMFGGYHEADAYRWTNPDGKEGGIVARTARIPEGFRLPYDCVVWPEAKIGDGSSMGNRSSMGYGSSMGDRSSMGYGSSMGNRSSMGDGAQYEADDWMFVAGPQGSRGAFATVIYSEKHGLRWWVGCQHGITTETLRKRIAADHGENEHAQDYLHLISVVESHPGLARKKTEFAAASDSEPATIGAANEGN